MHNNKSTTAGEGWVVVLYNDDHNDFQYVINTIKRVLELDVDRTTEIVTAAHQTGQVKLTITTKTTAARIKTQLKSAGLLCDAFLFGT